MSLTMQEAIFRLQEFWARHGALLWQPYHTEVGAGTANPATFLRVLGPEPWNVAYVEPSIRPDDSRYGDNPNRLQMHTQFQVILKPDPGNPQELYLGSLEAIGIRRGDHDLRFVEDNWESPALGAWGLGWEVWLDGMEITQYTYFQQSGGRVLDPVSVEITYGIERILMALQGVDHVMKLAYGPGVTYGEVFLQNEYEQSVYNLDEASIERVKGLFALYEQEALDLLAKGLPIPAYDYILKTSHTFNLLDSRGAVGVTERAAFFNRMRNLSRQVANAWVEAREKRGYPLLKAAPTAEAAPFNVEPTEEEAAETLDFVLEIGTEELPAEYVDLGIDALKESAPKLFANLRLACERLTVDGSPRRLIVRAEKLAVRQSDREELVKGPSAAIAFDAAGNPTKAGQGFARSKGLDVSQLERRVVDGGEYVFGVVRERGRPAREVLAEALPKLIESIAWPRAMRWNATQVAFGRPIRWIVALLGDRVVPFALAGVPSGRTSRGLRSAGSPDFTIPSAAAYPAALAERKIWPDREERKRRTWERSEALAAEVGGHLLPAAEGDLLDEVGNLVEHPKPILGGFEEKYLRLPSEVLITVMRKHQRYFPVVDLQGRLMPHFVGVANGEVNEAIVRHGYGEVLRARYADATFFWERDTQKSLEAFRPALHGLMFQEQLGSMADKNDRIERIVAALAGDLGLDDADRKTASRAAFLAKADLVTEMVMDFTSLQGKMGRRYAEHSGETPEAAKAIEEQYSNAPETLPGLVVGLADRLDSLVGLFAVGNAPRSSADPFALRRAAIGIIELLAPRRLRFDLRNAVAAAGSVQPVPVTEATKKEVLEFVARRLEGWLLDRGFRPDGVEAALGARGHDPAGALETAEQLGAVVEDEAFVKALTAYARCVRITRDRRIVEPVDPDRFIEEVERALYHATLDSKAALGDSADFNALVAQLHHLREPIDRFFDGVLVMAEDPAVRANRLALLQAISDLTSGIADLSRLQGF